MAALLKRLVPAVLGVLLACGAAAQSEPPECYGHHPYAEADPAELGAAGNYRDTGRTVRLLAPAAQAFQEMQKAAATQGVRLVPISGFRRRAYQAGLFRRAVERYGSEQAAARWVAPPGCSEHHTGRALDLGDETRPDCDVELCFQKTPAYRWMQANAERFGFELSFPAGSEPPAFEPWHWRYVGDAVGRRLFPRGRR